MRQRALGIVGGVMLVAGVALAVVSGTVAQSTANRNLLPAGSSIGNQRSEPGGLPIQRGQGPGPFFGGPGMRGPNWPGNEDQPAS